MSLVLIKSFQELLRSHSNLLSSLSPPLQDQPPNQLSLPPLTQRL